MLGFIEQHDRRAEGTAGALSDLVEGFSIEVMPRTAQKIESFRDLLPATTRVYIAHIAGTRIEDMVATAKRLAKEGFAVMPHLPARSIKDKVMLEDWIRRYQGEAGVDQALLLAGGERPAGDLHSSIQMMETGLFEAHGFKRLHVAGHPEGNPDIDPDGGTERADDALRWKQAFSIRAGIDMAIVTQFAFDARPILGWIRRLRLSGVNLPVHVGIAGPAKLQTLLKYAIACGVGPSLKVLQKRAMDITKLIRPYEPIEVLGDLAKAQTSSGHSPAAQIHFFPLGGLVACATWARQHSASAAEGAKAPA